LSFLSDVSDWLHRTYLDEVVALQDLAAYSPQQLLTDLGSKSLQDVLNGVWNGEVVAELFGTGTLLQLLAAGTHALSPAQVQALGQQYQLNLQGPTMTQLIIPGCFQVTISMVAGGHVIENVVGVQNATGTAPGAAAAVLAAWKVGSGPLSRLSNLIAMTGVRATDIGSSNGGIATVSDTTVGGQSTASALATRAACALVQWNGGTRSRSSRGRLYYGPIMETDITTDGATLGGTNASQFGTAMTNFRTSLSGSGYGLVVLSRKLSTAFPVTSSIVEPIIATQRRRIR
jgi:hypothetical protein